MLLRKNIHSLFILLTFIMLIAVSCHKGNEPVPYSNSSSDVKNSDFTSKSRVANSSEQLVSPKDTLSTVVGGDDNEEDDDDDDDGIKDEASTSSDDAVKEGSNDINSIGGKVIEGSFNSAAHSSDKNSNSNTVKTAGIVKNPS